MAKVNIAKLLKTKNRIASEIARLKSNIQAHNAYVCDKSIPKDEVKLQFDVESGLKELAELTDRLIKVKSAINMANVKSSQDIYALSEAKGMIAFLQGLDCNEIGSGYGYRDSDQKRVQISMRQRESLVKAKINEAAMLQDSLDEFNATTRIEIEDSVVA